MCACQLTLGYKASQMYTIRSPLSIGPKDGDKQTYRRMLTLI